MRNEKGGMRKEEEFSQRTPLKKFSQRSQRKRRTQREEGRKKRDKNIFFPLCDLCEIITREEFI
jgi:hypothetical protein